jgi:2-oxoisovalerate dehydrogenase E2 component (dihydrolipoyl transacylase)
MATKVLMPQLGESVTEGTISKWLVKVGDKVKKYDPICEVITDKVNAEVPSTVAGTITEIVAQEDETVPVGSLICYIQEEGTTADNLPTTPTNIPTEKSVDEQPVASGEGAMRKRYSPAVLKLANEHQVDLDQITGTGAEGRITRKDVLAYVEKRGMGTTAPTTVQKIEQKVAETPVTNPPEKLVAEPERKAAPAPNPVLSAGDIEIPVTPVRRAIAQRMTTSKHEAPHAWTMVEVDVTNLVQFRNQVKEEFKKREGINLTFLPFFIKAVVEAIKEFPILNSQWAGDKIIQKKEINISIAVATDDALYVPVIKRADEKSILGLARAIDELARKTREGKLTQEDITGGTFTVNNTGSFGSVLSMPIINYPQSAIISMEAIVKRPVIYNDMIAIRDMVNLCLSLDHRILDGLVCGRFLQSVKQKLESIGPDTKIY